MNIDNLTPHLFMYVPIYLPNHPSINLLTYLPTKPPPYHLPKSPTYLPIYLPAHPITYHLSTHPPTYPTSYLLTYLLPTLPRGHHLPTYYPLT
jgi:hypothetical protein